MNSLNAILAIFSIYKLDLFLPPISSRLSLHKYGVCFGQQQASRLAVIRAWTDFRRILIKTSTDAGELLPIFEIFDLPRRKISVAMFVCGNHQPSHAAYYYLALITQQRQTTNNLLLFRYCALFLRPCFVHSSCSVMKVHIF